MVKHKPTRPYSEEDRLGCIYRQRKTSTPKICNRSYSISKICNRRTYETISSAFLFNINISVASVNRVRSGSRHYGSGATSLDIVLLMTIRVSYFILVRYSTCTRLSYFIVYSFMYSTYKQNILYCTAIFLLNSFR